MNYKYHEKNWNLRSKATFLFYSFYFYSDFIEDIILTISLYSVFNSHIPCDAPAGTTFQGNNANIFMQVQHGNWVVHRISAWKLKKCAFKMSVNATRYKAKRPTMGTYFRSAFTERRDFLFTRTLSVNKYVGLAISQKEERNWPHLVFDNNEANRLTALMHSLYLEQLLWSVDDVQWPQANSYWNKQWNTTSGFYKATLTIDKRF